MRQRLAPQRVNGDDVGQTAGNRCRCSDFVSRADYLDRLKTQAPRVEFRSGDRRRRHDRRTAAGELFRQSQRQFRAGSPRLSGRDRFSADRFAHHRHCGADRPSLDGLGEAGGDSRAPSHVPDEPQTEYLLPRIRRRREPRILPGDCVRAGLAGSFQLGEHPRNDGRSAVFPRFARQIEDHPRVLSRGRVQDGL